MSSSTHSLRNQWGQAHVNPDLTSLSWLAIPPYAVGSTPGCCGRRPRPRCQRFRWAPWASTARRRSTICGPLDRVDGGTRRRESSGASWSPMPRDRSVRSTSPGPSRGCRSLRGDWGWTYGTPWSRATTTTSMRRSGPRRNDRAGAARGSTAPGCARPLRLGRLGCRGSSATRTATRCHRVGLAGSLGRPMLPAIGCLQSSVRSPRSHWSRRAANGPRARPWVLAGDAPNGGCHRRDRGRHSCWTSTSSWPTPPRLASF